LFAVQVPFGPLITAHHVPAKNSGKGAIQIIYKPFCHLYIQDIQNLLFLS